MEVTPDRMQTRANEGLFYSTPASISAAVLAVIVGVGCLFWGAAAVRWSQTIDHPPAVMLCKIRTGARYDSPTAPPVRQSSQRAAHSTERYVVTADTDSRLARRCKTIDKRIDWLNSRLRAGYRAAEGERWKQELRELKREKRARCRNLPD